MDNPKKQGAKQEQHLVPVVTVILAIAAFVAMYAFSIWPNDSDTVVSPLLIRHKKTTNSNANKNVNTNTAASNSNTNTSSVASNTNTASTADVIKDWKTYTNDSLVSIRYPKSYSLENNTEVNRRGSYEVKNITPQGSKPYLQEVQFFTRESIDQFNKKCAKLSDPCFFGDYPTVERYDGLDSARKKNTTYQGYVPLNLGDRVYMVKNIKNSGEGGFIREYNTFIGTTMVTIWGYLSSETQNTTIDNLIKAWTISYAGY